MLVDLKYPDAGIIDEIIAGFPITGWAQSSGVFTSKIRPPTMTLEQLKSVAWLSIHFGTLSGLT